MNDDLKKRELLSALADGPLEGDELAQALQFAEQDEGRETWQMYHLVGDVMRSAELARPDHGSAFLANLHQKMAQEPVRSLPPAQLPDASRQALPAQAANDSVFRWKMVAGVASLAAVMAVSWGVIGGAPASSGGTANGPQMALLQSPAGVSPANAVQSTDQGTALVVNTAQGPVLRDARLEQLLAEHRQYGGMSALQMPAGFLRDATHTADPQR